MAIIRRLGCWVTVVHGGSARAEGSVHHMAADPKVVDVQPELH